VNLHRQLYSIELSFSKGWPRLKLYDQRSYSEKEIEILHLLKNELSLEEYFKKIFESKDWLFAVTIDCSKSTFFQFEFGSGEIVLDVPFIKVNKNSKIKPVLFDNLHALGFEFSEDVSSWGSDVYILLDYKGGQLLRANFGKDKRLATKFVLMILKDLNINSKNLKLSFV